MKESVSESVESRHTSFLAEPANAVVPAVAIKNGATKVSRIADHCKPWVPMQIPCRMFKGPTAAVQNASKKLFHPANKILLRVCSSAKRIGEAGCIKAQVVKPWMHHPLFRKYSYSIEL